MTKIRLQTTLYKLLLRCKTLSFDDGVYLASVELQRLKNSGHITGWCGGNEGKGDKFRSVDVFTKDGETITVSA